MPKFSISKTHRPLTTTLKRPLFRRRPPHPLSNREIIRFQSGRTTNDDRERTNAVRGLPVVTPPYTIMTGQRVRQSRSACATHTRRGGAREKRAERPFRGQIKHLEQHFLRCAFLNVFSNGLSERMLHCLCHQHCNRHRFHIISLFTILFFIQVWIISTAPSSSSFFSMRHIFKASITYLCLSHQRQNKNCSIYTKDFSSCTKVIFLSKRIGISSNDDPATWCKIIITATIMIVSL